MQLHDETRGALSLPAVQEKLATLGVQPMQMSVDEFTRFVRDDIASTVSLAKDVNLIRRSTYSWAGAAMSSEFAAGTPLSIEIEAQGA